MRCFPVAHKLFLLEVLSAASSILSAQTAPPPSMKLEKPHLMDTAFVVDDSVETEQWRATLPVVNGPAFLERVYPGQCLRVAAGAAGENSAAFLGSPALGFRIHYLGKDVDVAAAPAASVKRIKPEGSDMVQAALDAGGVNFQVPASAALAVSAGRWCVPDDAAPGKLEVLVVGAVHDRPLHYSTVSLEIEDPQKVQGDVSQSSWAQTYFRHPEPGAVMPLLGMVFANDKAASSLQQFVVSIMQRSPAAVGRLGPLIDKAEPQIQAMAVKLARQAKVNLHESVQMSPMQKEFVEKLPDLPNAYVLADDERLFGQQDQLWAIFSVTGERKPVETIVGMLSWRKEYESFKRIQAEHRKVDKLTPDIARGVAYTSAGWSLRSFQQSEPLVADYLHAISEDPKTPENIRKELRGLDTNPAFQN